ncbi:MAG: NADH-quinone oxidoreductase subunit J [Candidatus Dormiibacterota bacterium]
MIAELLFLFLAAVAVVAAVNLIVQRRPINSVLSLVVVMLALAILFLLLSAQFVFIVQVIVYTGAVMVLFLFVVALLGPIRELATKRLGNVHWIVGIVAALVFVGFLYELLGGAHFRTPANADMSVFGTVESIGAGLFGQFLYPFELTSVLLVIAAIGAIYLSRGGRGPRELDADRRRARAAQPKPPDQTPALPADEEAPALPAGDREKEAVEPVGAANPTSQQEELGV